jgi:hypothetical protein
MCSAFLLFPKLPRLSSCRQPAIFQTTESPSDQDLFTQEPEDQCLNLSLVLGERGLNGLGVGADDGLDLGALLEEDEGGHGADAQLLGDVGDFVDVDFVEAYVFVIGLGVPVERGKGVSLVVGGGEGVVLLL